MKIFIVSTSFCSILVVFGEKEHSQLKHDWRWQYAKKQCFSRGRGKEQQRLLFTEVNNYNKNLRNVDFLNKLLNVDFDQDIHDPIYVEI